MTPAIDELLHAMHERGGTALHLTAALTPKIRVAGHLEPVADATLDETTLTEMLRAIAPPGAWATFLKTLDVEFGWHVPGLPRFRVTYFGQETGSGAIFRAIPTSVTSWSDLGLPDAATSWLELNRGLVLIVAPPDSGKSTTLGAFVDHINRTRDAHIVTIEDPIEFEHLPRMSSLSQRQVGEHTQSLATGLRFALRQSPDIIVATDLNDAESVDLALRGAEKGILVVVTLSSRSVTSALQGLVECFPDEQHSSTRERLSRVLEGALALRLLSRRDGEGRIAACEFMYRTPAVAAAIAADEFERIASLIEQGREVGMQSMDDSLLQLVADARISPREAYRKATDKQRFEPLLTNE
ncbi:MAG: ATPase, T2SS/T4P/T4SS family [Myxococcota bacterium]